MSSNSNDLRTPLKCARGLGSAKDGTSHFIWQRVTAVAVALSGVWLLGVLLSLRTVGYNYVRDLVVDPINATMLVVFLLTAFWHARLGLQVIIEDYVHAPLQAGIAHFANLFICALASVAGVLAVLRIAFGS